MLLGANVLWDLICVNQIRLGKKLPILQKTQLGWIVSGQISLQSKYSNDTLSCKLNTYLTSSTDELNNTLQRFWEIEDLSSNKTLSLEESLCQDHFLKHITRTSKGRFVVDLPFKEPISKLRKSYKIAEKRLYALEAKLQKNIDLKNEYSKFIHEYAQLGHMTKISNSNKNGYYLPHHCVLKDSSSTTKLRVVFDASSKTTYGIFFE